MLIIDFSWFKFLLIKIVPKGFIGTKLVIFCANEMVYYSVGGRFRRKTTKGELINATYLTDIIADYLANGYLNMCR